MMTYKQLSLADIFTDCQNKFDNDKFLELLENTINLDKVVPASFVSHFHAATGRPRRHLLYPMLKALLLQLIFSIPTTSPRLSFLNTLRDYGISANLTLYQTLLNSPACQSKNFRRDAAFDSIETYKYLLLKTSIWKAYIPLNGKISFPKADCPLNENGIPCCPKDPSLPMKHEGSKSHLHCSLPACKLVSQLPIQNNY